MLSLEEVLKTYTALPPDKQEEVKKLAIAATANMKWVPLPGPQTMAYHCEADELLYGGQAGGGKTDLLLGVAINDHDSAVIFRREKAQVDGLESRAVAIMGHSEGLNRQKNFWNVPGGTQFIQFGGLQHPGDEEAYKGRARDFYGFDEAGDFLEQQVAFVIQWLRSVNPKQRCRIIFATNPPTSDDGLWLLVWFAPWLDPAFPKPALPGELRWVIRVGDEMHWVDDRLPRVLNSDGTLRLATAAEAADMNDQAVLRPISRTFIPAKLADNPYLAADGKYLGRLQSAPKDLQERYLKGNWLAHVRDDDMQVIPSAWVDEAMARWTPNKPDNVLMTAIGVDVAQGGPDQTTLAPRYGHWFGEVIAKDGINTKDGPAVAGLVVQHIKDNAQANIDTSGGWGGSAYDHLKGLEISVKGFNSANGSDHRTKDKQLGFRNLRAEMHWRMREALDPTAEPKIALPPQPRLKQDLICARWKLTPSGIQIEDKAEIKKRLGRSPDWGDAVVLANASGDLRVKARRQDAQQSIAKVSDVAIKSWRRPHLRGRQTR